MRGDNTGAGKEPAVTGRPAIKGYLYVLGSILLVTLAQLAMKWGVMQLPAWQASLDIMLAHPVPLLVITAGVGCYALSLLCWLAALYFTPLNIAYPCSAPAMRWSTCWRSPYRALPNRWSRARRWE